MKELVSEHILTTQGSKDVTIENGKNFPLQQKFYVSNNL